MTCGLRHRRRAHVRVRAFALAALVALVAAPAALAGAVTNTTKTTIDLDFTASCPNEQIAIDSTATFIITATSNPTGGLSGHLNFILSGSGVGLDSGTVYSLHGVSGSLSYFRDEREFSATANVFMFVQTEVLVREGGGKPLSFQETLVAVFNANQELVSSDYKIGECQ
jgi:hypothetical protein